MPDWIYKEDTRRILGLVYAVRNELGGGWSEEIYHQALANKLAQENIPAKSKARKVLIHNGTEIHTFEADIIVWDKIILELKVLPDFTFQSFPRQHHAQILHYLKFYEMRLGLLINFAHAKVGIKRMIYAEPDVDIDEDYERMLPFVNEADKQILRQVQSCIRAIAQQYGLGYPETLYRRLLAVELARHDIKIVSDLNVIAKLDGTQLGKQSTPFILIADRFLLHIRSSLEAIPAYEFIKTRTYLRALNLKVGWVVNFGRKKLQIHATSTQIPKKI